MMSNAWFNQNPFDVRLEWGVSGSGTSGARSRLRGDCRCDVVFHLRQPGK